MVNRYFNLIQKRTEDVLTISSFWYPQLVKREVKKWIKVINVQSYTQTCVAHTILTTTHSDVQIPTYTTAVTLQQVQEIVPPLNEKNILLQEKVDALERQVAKLSNQNWATTRRCDELASQLRELLAAPQISDQNVRRGWHEQANSRIGARHSRAKPKHSFGCAHDGCDWRNKKVTVQAYVLRLKWKQGEIYQIIQIRIFYPAFPLKF